MQTSVGAFGTESNMKRNGVQAQQAKQEAEERARQQQEAQKKQAEEAQKRAAEEAKAKQQVCIKKNTNLFSQISIEKLMLNSRYHMGFLCIFSF